MKIRLYNKTTTSASTIGRIEMPRFNGREVTSVRQKNPVAAYTAINLGLHSLRAKRERPHITMAQADSAAHADYPASGRTMYPKYRVLATAFENDTDTLGDMIDQNMGVKHICNALRKKRRVALGTHLIKEPA